MPFRRRRVRATIGKDARKMSRSIIENLTTGTVSRVTVMDPTIAVGAQGSGDVYENADSEFVCAPNEIIKYVNIKQEIAVRPEITPANPGWLEYAFVVLTEQVSPDVAVDPLFQSNFGLQTLGETADNLYRGKNIFSGMIPLSTEVPQVLDLRIKIPKVYSKVKRGLIFQYIYAHRSSSSTDTTTSIRSIYSHQYKSYA